MVDNDPFSDKCHRIVRSFQYYENHMEMCVSIEITEQENSSSFEYFDPRNNTIRIKLFFLSFFLILVSTKNLN